MHNMNASFLESMSDGLNQLPPEPGHTRLDRCTKSHSQQCVPVPLEKAASQKMIILRTHHRDSPIFVKVVTWLKCPWCNGYCHRIWTQRHEFISWIWLIAFHIALIPLGKVWIQIFSLQLWVNSRADWVLQPWWGN